MSNALFAVNPPVNEKILNYKAGSAEKKELKETLSMLGSQTIQIPLIIGGKEIFTDNTVELTSPHNHKKVLAVCHMAGEAELKLAKEAALEAKEKWQHMPWENRLAVFLKAAAIIAGPYRMIMNAATMLCQSKTVLQAEIDCVAEMCDFLRFNAHYLREIYTEQPLSDNETYNRMEYRPLEGFVAAITPFNFVSIAGNLPSCPAMAGNTVVWKPSTASVYSNYFLMKAFMEAGLPAGVINFVPSKGTQFSETVITDQNLAGVHFTGSTAVFNSIYKSIAKNIEVYRTYPKIVGETGGKDYIFAHPTADATEAAAAIVRGAFEFQGQKCSAASRAYLPESLYKQIIGKVADLTASFNVGDPSNFENFMCAVIDEEAFERNVSYINYAKSSDDAEIVIGGGFDKNVGWFIEPTVIRAYNPKFKSMVEEIFGPIITVYVYEDDNLDETLALCDSTSSYGLTGAVFSQDRYEIDRMLKKLYNSAGNFYINDKPTGAVVGKQPFGGARASGTNDKAGSKLNLYRWLSPMAIKENYLPAQSIEYPHMEEK